MSLIDDLELIDKYIGSSLSEKEKIDFEQRLNADQEFKELYTDSRQLDELIIHQQLHQIKVQVNQHFESGAGGPGINFILGSVIGMIIIVAGLISIFVLYKGSKTDDKQEPEKPQRSIEQAGKVDARIETETDMSDTVSIGKANPGPAVIEEEKKIELTPEPAEIVLKESPAFIDVDTVVPFPVTNKFPKGSGALHENHYEVKTIETPELTVEFEDAHSQQTFTIVKLKITNKTSEYIVYRVNESVFKYDFGHEYALPKAGLGLGLLSGNTILIKPKSTEIKTLKVSGSGNHHVENLKLVLNGFYKLSATGVVVAVPDFALSADNAAFTAGGFQFSLVKSKQQFYKTTVRFNCTYTGSGYGIVNFARSAIAAKNNKYYPNENVKDKTDILEPGDHQDFTVEAQVYDSQNPAGRIVWNNTFAESTPIPLGVGVAKLLFDETVTYLKNK